MSSMRMVSQVSRRARILLVDDEEDTVANLAILLRMSGHEVDVARDGPTALRLAEDNPPDVALLDDGLPGGMDGCEIAQRLQERATDTLPFLIAVTGYGQDEDRRRCGEARIHLHLLKPVDPETLNRVLERFKAILGK